MERRTSVLDGVTSIDLPTADLPATSCCSSRAFVLVGDLGSLIRFVGLIFAALTVGAVFILR